MEVTSNLSVLSPCPWQAGSALQVWAPRCGAGACSRPGRGRGTWRGEGPQYFFLGSPELLEGPALVLVRKLGFQQATSVSPSQGAAIVPSVSFLAGCA